MTTSFTWSVQPEGLNVKDVGENQDTVLRVDFKIEATDGVNVAELFNSIELEPSTEAAFIPFSQLTEGMVLEWVKAAVPAERIARFEEILNRMLQDKRNPPARVVAKKTPWNTCVQG